MKISLYQKLAISLLVVFLLFISSLIMVLQSIENISHDRAEQELHKDLAEHLVNDNPLLSSGEYHKQALENLFHSMMILGPSFEFYVLDNDGKILTYSAKPGEVIRDNVDLKPIKNFVQKAGVSPLYANDPRSDQQKIFSAAPIKRENEIIGYLFVIIGGQVYDSILDHVENNERIKIISFMALGAVLFLLISLLVSFKFFVRPLKSLTNEVGNLSLVNVQKKLSLIKQPKSGSEVIDLSIAFNQLITKVNSQFERLAAVDNERRELLAHLSHDLRTPLASLQGFLETILLKKESLSQEEFSSYIKRCLKSAFLLKGFVDQIFELAHLESGYVTVAMEKFPVAELLYDLQDKFSVTFQKKQIDVDIQLASQDLMVTTDIAKLERVLTNLLENAIRHTAKGGKISLIVREDAKLSQAILIVKDNGTGIDQQELPYLFEPRYRGKRAVDDTTRHIGLGLTITKSLVKLLGGNIKAGNNLKGGAYFAFSLPLSEG